MQLYLKLLTASIKAQMQYKMAFLIEMCIYMALQSIDFLLVAAILLKFDHVGGWTLYEVGYMFGIASMCRSLYRLVAGDVHEFEKYIVYGEFDQLLTRPLSPLMLLLSRNIHLNQVGGLLQGLLIMWLCLWGLHTQGVSVMPLILYLPISLISGTMIVFALGLATAAVGFWSGRVNDLLALTIYGPTNASSYPMNIYPDWLRIIFFSLIPVAFATYVPALTLLHKGGPAYNLLLTPLVAMVAAALSLTFWRYGIKYYQSTGT